MMTPTAYEAWLQICKTPKEAVRNYSRYEELKSMDEAGELDWRHPFLKKEFAKLQRMAELANQFSGAHRYMVEKEKYNQQDIDYAFRLRKRERMDGAAGPHISANRTASATYISLMFQQIFKGERERFLQGPNEGGISEEDADNMEMLSKWLEKDLTDCILKKSEEMRMLIRGMKRAMSPDGINKDNLYSEVIRTIMENWLDQIFRKNDSTDKIRAHYDDISISADLFLMPDTRSDFSKVLETLVKQVLNEDRLVPDGFKRDRNGNV